MTLCCVRDGFERFARDRRAPDLALHVSCRSARARLRCTTLPPARIAMLRAKLRDVFDDVRGENDDDFVADRREQIEEAVALFGIETRGRFVDDDELRLADQRLRDAEALAHAAGISGERFLAHLPEIHLVEQRR